MSIRVGICGLGAFSANFIPLFRDHPLVEEVVLADLDPVKRADRSKEFGISRTAESLDELCAMDLDAIAIFTQNWLHGPQAAQALLAAKDVYSAVPSAITVEEMTALVEAVRQSGRIYMIGETSYYYPNSVYCRNRFRAGEFGHVVYSEGEYYHDFDHGLYDVMKWRGGDRWREFAGAPPMYYPTHSVSMVSSVTGAHATQVSCLGWVDRHDDGLFHRDVNRYGNEFSNESALFRMSDGSMMRINEFRRVGHPGTVALSVYGTDASFEEQTGGADGPRYRRTWATKERERCLDVSDLLDCRERDGFRDVSGVHDLARLPESYRGQRNGHLGSHQFLIDDFVRSSVGRTLPPNHVWAAARYLLPGLIAHESAKAEGALLTIPDFGDPPA
jgi:predicted dehydrogenase